MLPKRISIFFIVAICLVASLSAQNFCHAALTLEGQLFEHDKKLSPEQTVKMTLRIYDEEFGGQILFEENQEIVTGLRKSLFTFEKGDITVRKRTSNLAVETMWVEVETDGQVMTPRLNLCEIGTVNELAGRSISLIEASLRTAGGSALVIDNSGVTLGSMLNMGTQAINLGGEPRSTWPEVADHSITEAKLADGAVLAEILDDDGLGSGLNADYLDGLSSESFLTTSSDYGRSGVANNLYEGSETLTQRYLNNDMPETIQANSGQTVLTVNQLGTGMAIRAQSPSIAIRGESSDNHGGSAGVAGYNLNTGGIGVFGQGESKGVWGSVNEGGDGWSGFFDNRVKIGPNNTWSSGQQRGIYFGDGDFVYIGEKDGNDWLTLKANAFRFENGDIKVEGDDGWNSLGDEAIVGLGAIPEHFFIKAVYGDGLRLGVFGSANPFVIKQMTGNVGIGTADPSRKLTVRGNILLESPTTGLAVVEIGEGLDYAEGFDISDLEKPAQGSVLIIDPDNPGKLKVSTTSYDTKVAGIVAGANDLGSGVRLGVDRFDNDIALAGRVYCNVDAGKTEIRTGDLLTTANLPGYAMKADNYRRAQGAILGKAMESMEKGRKGQILVLVTLQ